MQNNRVFVYGTLKRGFGNHRLLEGSTFVDEAITKGEMRSLGGFPGVTLHGNQQIHGEIYAVDDETMERCDRLEGHPRWYNRQIVETSKGPAWMYTLDDSQMQQCPVVKDGTWR